MAIRRIQGRLATRSLRGHPPGSLLALVPPWIAIGLYFCIWHSLRHIYRLIRIDPQRRKQIENGHWLTAVTGFSCEAMPMTVAAIGVLSIAAMLQPISLTSLERFAGMYLAFIAALTFPHFLLALMDGCDEVIIRSRS